MFIAGVIFFIGSINRQHHRGNRTPNCVIKGVALRRTLTIEPNRALRKRFTKRIFSSQLAVESTALSFIPEARETICARLSKKLRPRASNLLSYPLIHGSCISLNCNLRGDVVRERISRTL
ncbi:MAG: hypothetical protein Ct9H300mP8_09750 [Gammaproteobacteria bacterium]|nr:MAG: hypothetical protein Ct9H300mP8_09750 [Gammaproteobacteria bacterium]